MQLVENHPTQILEERSPARVVGENAGVEHVGVGDQEASVVADVTPLGLGRVAVVGADGEEVTRLKRLEQVAEGGRLIL